MAVAPRSPAPKLIGAALLTIAGYYAVVGGEYSAFDLLRLEKQQQVEAERLAQVSAELDSLNAVIDGLENDPATIEAVARERFGMVREGEVLYRFLDVGDDPAGEAGVEGTDMRAESAARRP